MGRVCADAIRLRRLALPPAPRTHSGKPEAEQRQGCGFGNRWHFCSGSPPGVYTFPERVECGGKSTNESCIHYRINGIKSRSSHDLTRADEFERRIDEAES